MIEKVCYKLLKIVFIIRQNACTSNNPHRLGGSFHCRVAPRFVVCVLYEHIAILVLQHVNLLQFAKSLLFVVKLKVPTCAGIETRSEWVQLFGWHMSAEN